MTEVTLKSQRKTKNLGVNTVRTRDESYAKIEAEMTTAKCSDSKHDGDRILSVRSFYLNSGGNKLQGACIICQKNRRANRTKCCREKFQGKTKQEVHEMYVRVYGESKTCSKCKTVKLALEFPISIGMECGLHNYCITCSIGNSQGNGSLRDFVYMPDKDGIMYKKMDTCERCNGTNKLAVDHILPIGKGGTDCISNKQTLCIHCNSKKKDTIDCPITSEFLCERYKDASLNFTDTIAISHILSKKVHEFRMINENAPLENIKSKITEYAKKYNLGHNLVRIFQKIAVLFGK
jgi:hypothetical protein